ncbi:Saccharopine dehydrogenase [Lignoscripta atroalba]|nr:Saccharopine dehydrogenase [Lignoscripta atroalba]
MKTSTILSFRSLTSKIHPPLSLNPRETQKLLSLLTASFRQQLDQEHPRPATKEAHVTDNHFYTILTNPLFRVPSAKRRTPRVFGDHGHDTTLGDLQGLIRRPLEHFNQQVAAGTATIGTAQHCLDAHLKNLIASPSDDTKKVLRSSQAGAVILSWLWASGLEKSTNFLEDQSFVNALMPFMVAEGREQHVWRWLERLQDSLIRGQIDGSRAIFQNVSTQAHILQRLILSKNRFENTLDGAMETFLQASDIITSSPQTLRSYASKILAPAAKSLFSLLTQPQKRVLLRLGTFNSFVRKMDVWTSKGGYYHVLLLLHHPKHPDGSPALRYLKDMDSNTLEKLNIRKRRNIIHMSLKAAQTLLTQKRDVDAAWIMAFLQENFAQEIGSAASHPETTTTVMRQERPQESNETTNLRLLEALAGQ